MMAQRVKRQIRIREWAAQINACEQSGLSVKQWCEEAGICKKTYYFRRKRVHEELLDAIENGNGGGVAGARLPSHSLAAQPDAKDPAPTRTPGQQGTPVFAALPMPGGKGAAVTVWVGSCAVDIQNDADGALVEQVLRAVTRI